MGTNETPKGNDAETAGGGSSTTSTSDPAGDGGSGSGEPTPVDYSKIFKNIGKPSTQLSREFPSDLFENTGKTSE